MDALVTVDWLAQHLGDPSLLVLDASMAPPGSAAALPPDSAAALPPDSVPGAVRFDIEGRMSRQEASDGLGPVGAHDMLAPADFERELRALGVRDGDRIVVLDAMGIFSSARAWWMLRAAGIEAAVLDGGLPAWIEAGHPVARVAASTGRAGDVTVAWDGSAFVDADTTADALADGGSVVLDARSAARFSGAEPDPRAEVRAGHMPGARSLPYATLAPGGRMLPPAALAEQLHDAASDAPIIASCGSGVTAAVIALAATCAGRPVTVYDGSWSQWGHRESGRPVVGGA
ncbi:sulfurtransferase [Agrococcus sp. Ld7]|uniref:sulfurtransferase n=1 Tax=Agrococcus sp. Ld7 TaxID=649148 RepID=UPI00386CF8C5